MRALVFWRLSRDRGIALFVLVGLLLAAYSGRNLDRTTALLYLVGLSQGAIWGGLALLFVLYRRNVRAAARGELGMLLLLPRGPDRLALAQAAEFLSFAVLLGGGLLALGLWAVGRFDPGAASELLRLAGYLFLALGLPTLGLFQLVTAVHVAYRLGRVGVAAAGAVFLGLPMGIGWLLGRLDSGALWNFGPKVSVGSFRWLAGNVPGLEIVLPPGNWPAWPLAAGVLAYLLGVLLALAIYREAEV